MGVCEIDPFCQAVLHRNFPEIPLHDDINTLCLRQAVGERAIDFVVITTPCVDVSARGKGLAQKGEVCHDCPQAARSLDECALCLIMTRGGVQESNLFFVALDKVREYSATAGHMPTIISENVLGRKQRHKDEATVCSGCCCCPMLQFLHVAAPFNAVWCLQGRFMQPFLKLEADALLHAGYRDLGWREVSSEASGDPNAKHHIILAATERPSGVVDSLLFSTVRIPSSMLFQVSTPAS